MRVLKKLYKAVKWRVKLFYNKFFLGKKSSIPCNICGNTIFIKGPNGRLSLTGEFPWCPNCWSLERHRGLRVFWDKFPKSYFKSARVLQFSNDPAIISSWFCTHTISIYGGENSLDVQNIGCKDATYDIVLCNQVIEHVPDDKAAIKELLRVTKKDGFVQIGVPYPMELDKTIDWGFPKETDHGHYRNYGKDINILLNKLVGKGNWKDIIITDPVTRSQDYIYILCHSQKALSTILGKGSI
ncbi:class I SAM-dependent methyltransferase [Lutibacter sp.]